MRTGARRKPGCAGCVDLQRSDQPRVAGLVTVARDAVPTEKREDYADLPEQG